jgi:hypothetical protein
MPAANSARAQDAPAMPASITATLTSDKLRFTA